MERELLTTDVERRLRDGARLGLAAARARWLAIPIGVAAFAVGYFGGSKLIDDDNPPAVSPASISPEWTVGAYVAALRDGDGKAACELFTDAGRQDLLEGTEVESKSCAELIATVAPDLQPQLDGATVGTPNPGECSRCSLSATKVLVEVNTSDSNSLFMFVVKRKKGEWRINQVVRW